MWMSTYRIVSQVIEANLSLNYWQKKALPPSPVALHFVLSHCTSISLSQVDPYSPAAMN